MSNEMGESLWDIDVVVMPKAGVNDPEGEAILGGLGMLGYDDVRQVRSGKMIRLRIVAADEATAARRAGEMADRLLANPVIEVHDVRVIGATNEEMAR